MTDRTQNHDWILTQDFKCFRLIEIGLIFKTMLMFWQKFLSIELLIKFLKGLFLFLDQPYIVAAFSVQKGSN